MFNFLMPAPDQPITHYCRKKNERRKRGEFKEEWYWNGHLIRRPRQEP